MLEELEAEARWSATLATPESQELLQRLAGEAIAEHRAGKTELLDPEAL